jgi:hypothetical protein
MTQVIQLREKVLVNGWEYWIDKEKQVIYPTEVAKNGIVYDSDNGTYIFSNHLTPNERKQILDYIKYGR